MTKKKPLPKKEKQPAQPAKTPSRIILLWLTVICIVTALAYSPTIKNQLTNWDDAKYITENPCFTTLNGDNLKKMFLEYYMGNYHPLTMLSLTTDYLVAGRDRQGNINIWMFKTVNILLHIISTVLVFLFVFLLFRKPDVALVAAFLFGLHTLHVESVSWMSERKDVLYSAFFLASLVSYVQYARQNKLIYFVISLVMFALSLLSKGQAVSLAVSLVAIDYCLERKLLSTKVILEKIPFFVLAVIFGVVAVQAQRAASDITDYTMYQRTGFAAYGFFQYLSKLVLPVNLAAVYPYPDIIRRTVPAHYWLGLIPAVVIVAGVFTFFKKLKEVWFGVVFFVINIFLLLQFIPVGGAVYADRYAYIPSVGFCIIGGYGYHYAVSKYKSLRPVVTLILAVYLLVLGVLTFQRTQIWKTSLDLWNDVVLKQPAAVVAWNNRGSIKYRAKDYTGAIDDFDKAIEGNPDYDNAYYNRGTAKKDLGIARNDNALLQSAFSDFNKAISLNPDFAQSYVNRGFLKDQKGDQAGAILDFDKAIGLNAGDPSPYLNRGVAKGKMGRFKEAIDDFNILIQKFPGNASAYSNRGLALDQMGETKEAIADFSAAIRLDPGFVAAITSRGIALQKMKDFPGAIADFSKVITIDPRSPEPYYLRGLCYLQTGSKEPACSDFKTAGSAGHEAARLLYLKNCGGK